MPFYPSILPWYDQIFPFATAQFDFVLSYGVSPDLSIVDVGCGTGSLIIQLARVFRKTAGLDPDEAMLDSARRKAAAGPASTWFIQAGMLDLAKELAPRSVDRLICFGNTLPHLANEAEVGDFSRQALQVLRPGGMLMIQIINYDRILDQKLGGLPAIENEAFSFERRYVYPDHPTHVRFKTRLILKSTGDAIDNEVPLLAIRQARLRQILGEAGFSGFEEFGCFKKDSLTLNSQPFIVIARVSGD